MSSALSQFNLHNCFRRKAGIQISVTVVWELFCKSAFLIIRSITTGAVSSQSNCIGQSLAYLAYRGTIPHAEKHLCSCSVLIQLFKWSHHYPIFFYVLVCLERCFKYNSGRKIVTFFLMTKDISSTFSLLEVFTLHTVIALDPNYMHITENSL